MDSLTQIALGACIGQAFGARKLGNKAIIFGALGGLIPDLDVLLSPFTGEFGGWLYHRHFTHALWFGPVVGSLMAWLLWRHYGRQTGHLSAWMMVMILSLFTHGLLDAFTIYGTQLLAPFDNTRFQWAGVSIIDPLYTIPILIALFLGQWKALKNYAPMIASVTLCITTAFLFYGLYLNNKAEMIAKEQLAQQNIPYESIESFTTIFQPFLRRVLVKQENQWRIGFVSTWSPSPIYWDCKPQVSNDIRDAIMETKHGQMFDWFTVRNMSLIEGSNAGEILAGDARYGLPGASVLGWWGQVYQVSQNDKGQWKATFIRETKAEREASSDRIRNLFRAAYGHPNTLMMTEDKGC